MYKKYGNNDFETHKLEVTLLHNQTAKAGGWDYKSMSKVQMYDSTTKRKYTPYQFQQWLESTHIMASLKIRLLNIARDVVSIMPSLLRR